MMKSAEKKELTLGRTLRHLSGGYGFKMCFSDKDDAELEKHRIRHAYEKLGYVVHVEGD